MINIVFNVNLFWLIQEYKVHCQKCHLEQGALCDYGEKLQKLPGIAATISLSILLWSFILCHFQKNCLQPVLQRLCPFYSWKLNVYVNLFTFLLDEVTEISMTVWKIETIVI